MLNETYSNRYPLSPNPFTPPFTSGRPQYQELPNDRKGLAAAIATSVALVLATKGALSPQLRRLKGT